MGKYGCFYIQFHPDCLKIGYPQIPWLIISVLIKNPINWGIAHFQTQPNITYCWLCLPRFFSPFQKPTTFHHCLVSESWKVSHSLPMSSHHAWIFHDFPLPATMGRDGLHLVGHVGGVAANAVEAGNFPLSTGLAPRVGTRPPQRRCLFLTKMKVFQMI